MGRAFEFRNIKDLVMILAFLVSIPAMAQKSKATLFFKDGRELKGLAKITASNKIKFRKEKGAEKQIFDGTSLSSVIIKELDGNIEYAYKKVGDKRGFQLLKVVTKGKLNLYAKTASGYMAGPPMAGGMTMGHYYSISNYYVSKNTDINADFLTSTGILFGKSFKKSASEYFKDCSKLVEKIQNKEFKKRDIEKIVEFYNEECE